MTTPNTEQNKGMAELQSILMQTLKDVREGTVQSDQAKTINSIAQTLINSAKAETEYLRTVKKTGSSFFCDTGAVDEKRITQGRQGDITHNTGPWTGLVHQIRDDDDEGQEGA